MVRHVHSRRMGFTLIELLVVIAIISILASILFPVFAKARSKARQISCLSNLKQMVMAVSMYAGDYDGTTPSCHFHCDLILIQPYIRNWDVYRCPSEGGYYDVRGYHIDGNPNVIRRVDNGYVANASFFGGSWYPNPNTYRSHSLADFDRPTHLPIYVDHVGNEGAILPHIWYQHVSPLHTSDGGPNGSCRIKRRHLEVYNMAFADGHVKSVKSAPPQIDWYR